MKKGSVKFYNSVKGYGFIIDDETANEIFLHATGLANGYTPREGSRVQFDTKQGKKGLVAINVKEE